MALRLRGGVENEGPEIAAGFAAAGGTAADDVASCENEGQSGGLDGRGAKEVLLLDGALKGGGEGKRVSFIYIQLSGDRRPAGDRNRSDGAAGRRPRFFYACMPSAI